MNSYFRFHGRVEWKVDGRRSLPTLDSFVYYYLSISASRPFNTLFRMDLQKNRIYLHAASSERSSYAKGQLGGLAGTAFLPAFLYGGKAQKIIYSSYPRTVQKVSLGGFHVG